MRFKKNIRLIPTDENFAMNADMLESSILEDIQAKYSYLPQHALQEVAEKTGKSLVDIYGVATFYKAFSLKHERLIYSKLKEILDKKKLQN